MLFWAKKETEPGLETSSFVFKKRRAVDKIQKKTIIQLSDIVLRKTDFMEFWREMSWNIFI